MAALGDEGAVVDFGGGEGDGVVMCGVAPGGDRLDGVDDL